ncbi:MAG: hypothetical protein U1D55_05715 [Phycisphaerae bacterium]
MNSGGGDGTWAPSSGALACTGITTTLSGHSGVPDVAQGSILLIDKAALQTVWLDCTATLSSGCDNAGLVFAYVDHLNFWVRIYSKAQQKILDYQVVNGAWTQKNSSNTTITAGVAFGMATQVRAGQGSWISGTCPAGQVGLWASHGTANSFDNFKVRDRAGPYEVDGKWFADVGDVRVDNADNNVLETFGSDYQERCVVRRGFRGEKFVATFRFKWNGGSSTSPGFLVRWLNPGDWVAVYVKSSDGKARLDRRKDDGVVTNLATGANALSLTSGTWYAAKVVVDDDLGNSALQRLRLYVDANANGFGDDSASLDTTAVDDDFSAGYCGLFRSNLYADVQQLDDFKLGIDNSSPKDGDFDDAGDEVVIDDNFNSTTTNLAYDDNGNLTDDGVFKYAYDAWNRLAKVTWRIKSPPSSVAVYSYDGANRRVTKVVTNSGVEYVVNDGGNTTLHLYWGGMGGAGFQPANQLLEERNGSDRALRQYAWGPRGRNDLLFMDSNGDSSGSDCDADNTAGGETAYLDKRYFAHEDRAGNVVALTEYVPNGGGGVAGRIVERRYLTSVHSAMAFRADDGAGETASPIRFPRIAVDLDGEYIGSGGRAAICYPRQGDVCVPLPPPWPPPTPPPVDWQAHCQNAVPLPRSDPRACQYRADEYFEGTIALNKQCKYDGFIPLDGIIGWFGERYPDSCKHGAAWPLECVCRNMGDSPEDQCVRGCLQCIHNVTDSTPDAEQHNWCVAKCVSLIDRGEFYRQLDRAIGHCILSEGCYLGPGKVWEGPAPMPTMCRPWPTCCPCPF